MSQSQSQTQTQTLGYSFNEDDNEDDPWGRLCPTSSHFMYPVFEFLFDEFMIGRDAEKCEIELKQPQISAVHTKIVRNPNYGLDANTDSHIATIFDLSTNGTYLNKRKIGKGNNRLLFDGDEMQFIQYCKKDKKSGVERRKLSFLFYANRAKEEYDEGSVYAKYDIRTTLGTGSFAVVKLGIDRNTGDRFAVKEIDKKKYELKSKSRKTNSIMNEADILQKIDHQNIIKVYDVFDENQTLYIVLEMAFGGELFQRIVDEKKLSEPIAKYVTAQLLDAIMYLHDRKIAHRDLKPENILMVTKGRWEVKITDFGLSRLLEYDYEMLTTMCGTPLFLAPEVLNCNENHTFKGYGFEVDYWSIGVVLYLMLVGHPPYNQKEGSLLDLVKNHKFSFPNETWKAVSKEAKDLVVNLMRVDPKKRFKGNQVMKHPWMKDSDSYGNSTHSNGNGNGNANNSNSNSNTNNGNRNMKRSLSKKRKKMSSHPSEPDRKEESANNPPRKKHRNNNLMSMDSMSRLTPFDSINIVNKKEAKNKKHKFGNDSAHFGGNNNNFNFNNDPNGNGASSSGFVLKNSVSMKEMSLD